VTLEQQVAIDDSLLPSAIELEKLKEIDPSIIQWIMKRAEIEQDARIEFNRNQNEFVKYNLHKSHKFNLIAIIFSFILFLVILGLSAFFIIKELPVAGTIFGGTAIIAAITFFIKAASKPQN
jgi:uncharacterized membrane protein